MPVHRIILATERLILRKITLDDLEDFYALDSNAAVHRYLGNNPVTSREQCEGYIQNILEQYEQNGIGRFAMIDKTNGNLIGWAGLKYETGIRPYAYYDIGYRLKECYWGQGYATEAAQATLAYGFDELRYDKICGAAHVDNVGSNKILQKIGLTFTESFEFDGEMHNWYEATNPNTKL